MCLDVPFNKTLQYELTGLLVQPWSHLNHYAAAFRSLKKQAGSSDRSVLAEAEVWTALRE